MKKLNDNMKAFCEEYLKQNYNGAKAYGIAYNNDNKQACATGAYGLLKDTRVLDEIKRLEGDFFIEGLKQGMSKKRVMEVVNEMTNATKIDAKGLEQPDWTARNNAVLTWAKLTGEGVEKKVIEWDDVTEVPVPKSKEEAEKLKKELIAEM